MNSDKTIKFFNSKDKAMSYALKDYSRAFRESIEDFREPVLQIKQENRLFPAFCAFESENGVFYACAFITKEEASKPVFVKGCNSLAHWNTHEYDPSKNGVFGSSSFPTFAVPLASEIEII